MVLLLLLTTTSSTVAAVAADVTTNKQVSKQEQVAVASAATAAVLGHDSVMRSMIAITMNGLDGRAKFVNDDDDDAEVAVEIVKRERRCNG
uniref:Secreted protein n=1 Tax=Onchocerca volvulus TaxID=6282 RepID=A0A8R1U1V4_ONCVO